MNTTIDGMRQSLDAALARIASLTAERDDLQAKLIESQREKEARFDCHAGPGTTRPACGACVTCLLREVETLQAKLDDLVCSIEEYLIAPATTGMQVLREALWIEGL